jgi:ATP-binding cassette subfamily B protein/subfamily B ATP-binding cassette protein MsbA
MLALLATMLLTVGIDVLRPWPLKVLVDNVLEGKPLPASIAKLASILPGAGTNEGLLIWTVTATVGLFLLGWLLSTASIYAGIGFGQRLAYDLAEDLFAHLQRLSLSFHSRKSVGDSIRRVTTDSNSISTILKDAVFPMLSGLVTVCLVFAIMWSMDHELTLLALLVVPALVITLKVFAAPMMRYSCVQQEAEGQTFNVVEETLAAIPAVHAYNRQQCADARFRASTGNALEATLETTRVQLQFKIISGLVTALGTAVMIYVGAQHALQGSLTMGSIIVFLAYLASLYAPLESLMYTSSTVQGATGSGRRVMEILQTEQDVSDKPGARPLPPVRGHIIFDGITFGYEPDAPVLKSIYLDILPGETVALVGPSGAGKSTLASMLPRFADPWSGHVWVDGFDVRDVTLRSLREQVSVVGQEPLLLPVTIAENIAYGRPDATSDQIRRAAEAANIHTFIEQLADGYETIVGERGATLSGGERQRLAIARALLKNAPILILDEPTSALDARTEHELIEALGRLVRHRTTVIIAHRLSTLQLADRIVVIDEGRIVQEGTKRELLRQGGLFAALYSAQLGLDASQGAGAAG